MQSDVDFVFSSKAFEQLSDDQDEPYSPAKLRRMSTKVGTWAVTQWKAARHRHFDEHCCVLKFLKQFPPVPLGLPKTSWPPLQGFPGVASAVEAQGASFAQSLGLKLMVGNPLGSQNGTKSLFGAGSQPKNPVYSIWTIPSRSWVANDCTSKPTVWGFRWDSHEWAHGHCDFAVL